MRLERLFSDTFAARGSSKLKPPSTIVDCVIRRREVYVSNVFCIFVKLSMSAKSSPRRAVAFECTLLLAKCDITDKRAVAIFRVERNAGNVRQIEIIR